MKTKRKPPPHAWKPGQSGNPAGRPKGQSFTAVLRELLDEADPVTRESLKRAVSRAMIAEAIGGNVQAAQWIADRADGKVKEVLELERPRLYPELSAEELAAMVLNAGKQGHGE